MKSRYVYLVALPLVFIFWSFSNLSLGIATSSFFTNITAVEEESIDEDLFIGPLRDSSLFDVRYFSLAISPPDSFLIFRESLAFKESQGKYGIVNTLGYLGKYQFGMTTLSFFGVNDSTIFLNSPRLQERIFIKNLQHNYGVLEPYIEKYAGKKIAGIQVTESGILAAAHLSGAGGVKRFFKTKGRKSNRDAYGSSVKAYMKRFAGYDLSDVIE